MSKLHIIPDRNHLKETIKLCDEYDVAFEYNDFMYPDVLDDTQHANEIVKLYRDLNRDTSKDTLHGDFFDVTVASGDAKIRELSQMRIHQSMEIASQLGVCGVILHSNYIPQLTSACYDSLWLDRNYEFFCKLVVQYPNINIYMENMFDSEPDVLVKLAEMIDQKNFGLCMDIAHAFIFGTEFKRWFEAMGTYIRHIHMNDNDGKRDLHMEIGAGILPWQQIDDEIRKLQNQPSILVEVNQMDAQRKSIEYLIKTRRYPF